MTPTLEQLELTKWRCDVLRASGCLVRQDCVTDIWGKSAKIIILRNAKMYRFSDPDWDVVNKQLSCMVNICAMS